MSLGLIFAALLGVAAGAAPSAAPAPPGEPACIVQTFATPEDPVTATFCSGGDRGNGYVTVSQTYASHGKSMAGPILRITVVEGAGVSRGSGDVSLAAIGIPRTLRVHVSYANGAARMTGGVLLPGAIPVTPADH